MSGGRPGDARDPGEVFSRRFARSLLALNVAVELLAGLLVFSLAFPDLPQFAGKAMPVRALTYPWAALLIPAVWWLRGRPSPYPHLVDALIVLPFLIDVAGNAANLYDATRHFDDVAHLVDWALLTTAFGVIMASLPVGKSNAAALTLGFGATTDILWEICEYLVSRLGSDLHLTYEDTIGDWPCPSADH